MQDFISVIIPTYNGEKYIKECIESIQAQDFPNEIIVIDDISTEMWDYIVQLDADLDKYEREHFDKNGNRINKK